MSVIRALVGFILYALAVAGLGWIQARLQPEENDRRTGN